MKIGLFGGTFDPIHNGHLGLAESIIKYKLLGKIIFIPAARPPHKPEMPVTSFSHRANMVKLAIKGTSYFELSEVEEKRLPFPSYAYDTVKWFSSNFPFDEFSLIIGEDNLAQIHTWHNSEELIELCEIITYPRSKENFTLGKLKKNWPLETVENLFRTILPLPTFDISATTIRESIKMEKGHHSLIPLSVCNYIEKHGLYK